MCVQMEEVPGELAQDDLAPDNVMILDVWDHVSLTFCPHGYRSSSYLLPHYLCPLAGVCLDWEPG